MKEALALNGLKLVEAAVQKRIQENDSVFVFIYYQKAWPQAVSFTFYCLTAAINSLIVKEFSSKKFYITLLLYK